MRCLFLASSVLFAPALACASPQCAIPPGPWTAEHSPAPLQVAATSPLEGAAPVIAPTAAIPSQALPGSMPPVLKHITDAGARISDLGSAHGLRSVVARTGRQWMFYQVVPDGSAVVGGPISELTPPQLLTAAGDQAKELGISHGLRTIFVDLGAGFQVAYVTPDGERVIPGAMWDATGHNVTHDQVAPIEGTIATVEVGTGAQGTPVDAATSPAAQLAAVEKAAVGTAGDPSAPRLYMVIDPTCGFSVRAMQQLAPLVAKKRLQVAIIPISLLDGETDGRSTAATLAMLSLPAEQMIPAWEAGTLNGPVAPEAPAKLAGNRLASEQVGLRGTPTVIWRKADGSVGHSDGLPSNLDALVASMAH